jgi:hypothetical protein
MGQLEYTGVNYIGINFKVAIYSGFAGAIFYSAVPIIFNRKSFKEFMENFFIF